MRLHHSLFLGLFPDIIFKCELNTSLSFLFPSSLPPSCTNSVVWVIPGCSGSDLIALSPPPSTCMSRRGHHWPSTYTKNTINLFIATKVGLSSKTVPIQTLEICSVIPIGGNRMPPASATLWCDNSSVLCSHAEWMCAQYREIENTHNNSRAFVITGKKASCHFHLEDKRIVVTGTLLVQTLWGNTNSLTYDTDMMVFCKRNSFVLLLLCYCFCFMQRVLHCNFFT